MLGNMTVHSIVVDLRSNGMDANMGLLRRDITVGVLDIELAAIKATRSQWCRAGAAYGTRRGGSPGVRPRAECRPLFLQQGSSGYRGPAAAVSHNNCTDGGARPAGRAVARSRLENSAAICN